MAVEIRKGFQGLEAYVEIVSADPEKAERIRRKQAEVDQFLVEEGLSTLNNPRAEVVRVQKEQAEQERIRYQNHLAAVAQEAIRVEGDRFVHDTAADVVRSLRERIAAKDPRLIPGYTDSTLRRQILRAGEAGFNVAAGMRGHEQVRMSLGELLNSEDFQAKFNKYEGWIETFTYASQVLPKDTGTGTMMFLLFSYSKDVGPDLTQFRTVQGRVTEIQRGLLRRPAA